jgi:hypothetical protein
MTPMNLLFLIAKIIIVAFFLFMFLRSNKMIWGIGLLTVTSAILLDAFLGTFGREEMIEQFGFFYYALAGALFAGAALWLWGILRPYTRSERVDEKAVDQLDSSAVITTTTSFLDIQKDIPQAAVDHPVLYEKIRKDFGEDAILDLEFDMGYTVDSVPVHNRDFDELAVIIIDSAERNEEIEELRLAVERIQTPLPPEHLPRIEKIQADSPQTVLRHYLVANCTFSELESISTTLGVNWGSIPGATLNAKVRNLLLDVARSSRQEELIALLQRRSMDAPE